MDFIISFFSQKNNRIVIFHFKDQYWAEIVACYRISNIFIREDNNTNKYILSPVFILAKKKQIVKFYFVVTVPSVSNTLEKKIGNFKASIQN